MKVMKKVLSLLFTLTLILGLCACSGSGTPVSDDEAPAASKSEDAVDSSGEGHAEASSTGLNFFIPVEDAISEDDPEHEMMAGLQGKFQFISGMGNGSFIADNRWYTSGREQMTLDGNIDFAHTFYKPGDGMVLMVVRDSVLEGYNIRTGECYFTGIPFDAVSDVLMSFDTEESSVTLLREAASGYEMSKYSKNEETNKFEVETLPIESVKSDADTVIATEFELFAFQEALSGPAEIYVKTESGELYLVDTVKDGFLFAATDTAPISNVDRVIYPTPSQNLSSAIYTKAEDSGAFYGWLLGDKNFDDSDDVEVRFVLPEGVDVAQINKLVGFGSDWLCLYTKNNELFVADGLNEDVPANEISFRPVDAGFKEDLDTINPVDIVELGGLFVNKSWVLSETGELFVYRSLSSKAF